VPAAAETSLAECLLRTRDPAAEPLGSLTPLGDPLIKAQIPSERPGPPHLPPFAAMRPFRQLSEVIETSPGEPRNGPKMTRAGNLQWFSGYYHHDAARTSIDPEKQHKLVVAVGQHCGLHRHEKVIDVYGRFFREIYQGRRASR
jgi:hypothetical protein